MKSFLDRWSRTMKKSKKDVITYYAYRGETRFMGIKIDRQNHKEELQIEDERIPIGLHQTKKLND